MIDSTRGLKALEYWAKSITSSYKNVDVRDLSTSFRDGLAFCAIVHHYRPDLIDYDSLSKENIFENNSLAFSVAEKQLGVPALLDAEDMVKYSRPDRLSIITYLSQLRNCFENQNKVNKKPELKRVQKNSIGPPAKVPGIESFKRHEVCLICKHRVFILERLMVDGKLYHRTCFRCNKCNNILNPGAYVVSDTEGLYECTVCPHDETSDDIDETETAEKLIKHAVEEDVITQVSKPVITPEKEFTSKEALNFVKSNLSDESSKSGKSSPVLRSLRKSGIYSEIEQDEKKESRVSISVKDKINAFEKNQASEKISPLASPSTPVTAVPITNEKESSSTSPLTSVIPVPKPRHSLMISTNSENDHLDSSKRFSDRPSLFSPKSPEKFDRVSENESLSNRSFITKDITLTKETDSESFITKDITLTTETDSEEKLVSGKFLNNHSIERNKDESVYANSSLYKISKVNSDITSNEKKNLNGESSILSLRSGSESPKITRDIFKSSLPPLKLSLLSTRREPFTAPVALSQSDKTVEIPQIKSSYSFSPTERLKHSEIKESSSETNLSSNIDLPNEDKVVRRSSLESSSETGNKKSQENFLIGTKFNTFHRANSASGISNQVEKDVTRTGLKTYTPIYKSTYSTLNTTSNVSAKIESDNSLSSKVVLPKLEYKLNEPLAENKLNEPLVENKLNEPLAENKLNESSSSVKNLAIESKISESHIADSQKINLEITPSIDEDKVEAEGGEEEEYPDDLNPFGDEEVVENEEEYPDDLNPFGDDDGSVLENSNISTDEVISCPKITSIDYDESKNPFASDEDEDSRETPYSSLASNAENRMSNLNDSLCSNVSSPSNSLKGTMKKRKAPKPPNVKDIFPKDGPDSGIDSSFSSARASPSVSRKNFQASSPKVRKNKPAPPPPPLLPPTRDPAANVKMNKETDNMKLKSSTVEEIPQPKQYKKKKRPAPSVPVHVRRDMKKIPMKEIIREMKDIEEKQREFEKQGREIELLIRDRDKDEEPSIEEEENIMQLFELVNQKNALFRRQAELMYIKRSQRLEEQQYQVEQEIRRLMEKPDSEKTEEDRQKEEELTLELIDIVDQRNSIIDSIEMDRRRELEEDHSVQEQLEIKNGELPITAEIKQKSGKKQKNKAKKEKKKQLEEEKKKQLEEEKKKQLEEESGKGGTLKKKKNIFAKLH